MNKSRQKETNETAAHLSREQTADLLSKASKVSTWMSVLKNKAERRPCVGVCDDESVIVTIRDHRIESIQTREDVGAMPLNDILARICEAHNDALDKLDAWTISQYETMSKELGIDGEFRLPF